MRGPIRTALVLLLGLAALCLAGCGSAPSASTTRAVTASAAKLTRVVFFYQDTVLTTTGASGNAALAPSPDATGLFEFGNVMVPRARPAFHRAGVEVIHASVAPSGALRAHAMKMMSDIGKPALAGASAIIVLPRRGSTHSTVAASLISMSFEVRVVDLATSKVVWTGNVDTSTWNGKGMFGSVQGARFDRAYADQFLATVIDELRGNSLI